MGSGEHDETPTVAEPGPDSEPMHGDAGGLESRVLLARARGRLLGWQEEPAKVGRYRVLERIGTGGMGVIFAAQDDELDRPVAIKILRSDVGLGTAGRQRLIREAQAIARLSHPNILHVYEVGQDEGQVYLAMELVRGPTLRQWCTQAGRTPSAIIDMFARVGEGLAAAHTAGIVHRDFKPDNALVGDDGRPRVIDFGLARPRADAGPTGPNAVLPASASGSAAVVVESALSSSNARMRELDVTVSGTVVGTPAYMAPEQLERREPDARTDQFSFCASLFEMLYGSRPFGGSSYTELARAISSSSPALVDPRRFGVPLAVHELILRGLRRDPQERYATMDELLAALRRAGAPPRSPWPRRAAALGLAGIAAALLAWPRTPTETPAVADAAAQVDAARAEWPSIVAASELPSTIASPLPGDPTGTTVARLENGLTVYVSPRPHEPYVAVTLAVRAGIREESPATPLASLLVVESIYRGSERIGVVDVALERPMRVMQHRLLEALPDTTEPQARAALLAAVAAADLGSAEQVLPHDLGDASVALGGLGLDYVVSDGTTIAAELPRHRLDGWLELLAEGVRRPVFRNFLAGTQQHLAGIPLRAAGAQTHAIERRELAAATGLHADFADALAYLRTIPLDDAREFHRTWFVPNNTALVFVGDVTMADVLPLAERWFGDWEPRALPELGSVDAPLAEPVVRHAITDHGPPALSIAWPLPPTSSPEYPKFLALADALAQDDGLGAALAETAGECEAWVSYARELHVLVTPHDARSFAELERDVMAFIDAIAEQRLPEEAWQRGLARAGLERASWAFSAAAASTTIAGTFVQRRQWPDAAVRLAGVPERAELVAAARALRERSRVVVQRSPGPTWRLPDAAHPLPRMTERYGRHGEQVKQLVDAAVTPPEPRFLVEGSHYESTARGAGRVITVASDSPLVRMHWIYPLGVDEDPFVCAAVHAHVAASEIAGVDLEAHCTHDDVWVDVSTASEGFAARAPALFAFLDDAPLGQDAIHDYLGHALPWRASVRSDPQERAAAFHAWAARGEHGIDAHLPGDAELARDAMRAMPLALARARSFDADVCYVGPQPAALAGLLPAPRGLAPASHAEPPRTRELARPTIFLLHDPEADRATVRVAMPWVADDVKSQLAALVHTDVVAMSGYASPGALQWVQPGWNWWMPEHPLATEAGYRASAADVPLALRTALAVMRERVDGDEFTAMRRKVEIRFRAARLPDARVPERVRMWGQQATDPRVAQWLALPALSPDDMARYYERIAGVIPIVSIVGDADAIDLAALREHGELRRFEIADLDELLRDDDMTDAGT